MKTLQRRRFLIIAAAAAASLSAGMSYAAETKKRMRIGVIGSGRIGGTLGGLFAKAGHEVMFSDRDRSRRSRPPQTRARTRAPAARKRQRGSAT